MKKMTTVLLAGLLTLSAHAQDNYTLEQCIEAAKAHNKALQSAVLDIKMADEQKKEAYTQYFPKISANVMAFQAFDKIMKGDGTVPMEIAMLGEQFMPLIGMPIEIRELNRMYSATLSVMQPVYAGGQITTGNKLASLQQDVMQLQLEMKEKDIVGKVTECFWQIASLRYQLSTLDAADKQLGAVYDNVEAYVKAGVTTSNDLLKVRLQQQKLASNRLKVENGLQVLQMLLAQQCGLGVKGIQITIPEDAMSLLAGDAGPMSLKAQDASSASLGRTEYQLMQASVDAQAMQVKMERGKLLPTVAVGLMGYNTGMGGMSDRVKQYMKTNMTNAMVLGTVSVPVSDWWGGTHALRRQKLKLEQAQNDLQDVQEKLAIDLESAWANVVEAYKQIDILRTSVEEAAENLRMSQTNYKAGVENLTDLLDAETMHRQAQNDLSSAVANYQIALAQYRLKLE